MDKLIGSMNKIMRESTTPHCPTVMPADIFDKGNGSREDSTAFVKKKGKTVTCRMYSCPAYIFEFEDGTVEKPKVQTTMPHCARCRKARYCSKTCQRADWKRHKPECVPVAEAAAAALAFQPMVNSKYGMYGSTPYDTSITVQLPPPPPATIATTPTGWSVGYLFRRTTDERRGEDNYILVMFPWYKKEYMELRDFYANRVYFIEYANNPVDCALYLEKSYEAERYRDGGSTFIKLDGNRTLSMPHGKESQLVHYREEEEPNEWAGEEGEPETMTVNKAWKRERLIDLSELGTREMVLSTCDFLRRFMEDNQYLIRKPLDTNGAGQ